MLNCLYFSAFFDFKNQGDLGMIKFINSGELYLTKVEWDRLSEKLDIDTKKLIRNMGIYLRKYDFTRLEVESLKQSLLKEAVLCIDKDDNFLFVIGDAKSYCDNIAKKQERKISIWNNLLLDNFIFILNLTLSYFLSYQFTNVINWQNLTNIIATESSISLGLILLVILNYILVVVIIYFYRSSVLIFPNSESIFWILYAFIFFQVSFYIRSFLFGIVLFKINIFAVIIFCIWLVHQMFKNESYYF